MKKADLIDKIAREAGITKKASATSVDAIIDGISGALARKDTVTLVGFGTFYVGRRAARMARNPRTGAPLDIPAKNVPRFRPGSELLNIVSELPGIPGVPLYKCPKPPLNHFVCFANALPKDGKCPRHHVKLVKIEEC
ncbi:HU family DNA-binding protein [candidate division WOR-3 bacterium]|nr:HU family DNA-binding protein [candidate division WOR-3 bacterium]